jgi:hypothetical protein
MKNQSFTVKLKFESDDKGIHRMEVLEINGEKGKEAVHVQSTEPTYLGTIGTTIILTKSDEEADPCVWIWNPILRRWFVRCWWPQT